MTPISPGMYGPFYRRVTSTELSKVVASGMVCGGAPRNYFGGGIGAAVKASNGPLPARYRPAYELYTSIRPSAWSPADVHWSAGTAGVFPFPINPSLVCISVILTTVRP